MKVVNICWDDYANFSHENANALRSVGIDCVDLKLIPHVFGYSTESQRPSGKRVTQPEPDDVWYWLLDRALTSTRQTRPQ